MTMLNSRIPAQWVEQMCAENPPGYNAEGALLLGLCRLAYVSIHKPKETRAKKTNELIKVSYEVAALIPPCGWPAVQKNIEIGVWVEEVRKNFAAYINPADGWPVPAVKRPFKAQDDRVFDVRRQQVNKGFQAGSMYINLSSIPDEATGEFQGFVVDAEGNDIPKADRKKRVYNGAWAIPVIRPYPYNNESVGVSFGLMGLIMVADDDPMFDNAGAADPKKAFAGVKIDRTYSGASKFAAPGAVKTPPGAAPPPSVMPPSTPIPPPAAAPAVDDDVPEWAR